MWKKQLKIESTPYKINTDETKHNFYFMVGDNMPSWNIFVGNVVEHRSRAGKKLTNLFLVEDERRAKYVKELQDTFCILKDIPEDFESSLVLDVVKVCLVVMNMFNRRKMVVVNGNKPIGMKEVKQLMTTNGSDGTKGKLAESEKFYNEWELSRFETDDEYNVGFETNTEKFEVANDKGEGGNGIVQELKRRCEHESE